MNLGAILDNVQSELENYVLQVMQQNGLPPSLMEKCIEGVQSNIRRLKAEEYAEELASALSQSNEPVTEQKTGTVEDLKRELEENGGICGAKE